MNREVHISIAPGTIFTALFIIAGAYVFWLLRDLVLLVITAIVIASAIEPGVAFFIRYRIPRFISALLVYVLVSGSIFSLLYFFFPPIIADAANFLSAMPKYLETLNASSSFSNITNATTFVGAGKWHTVVRANPSVVPVCFHCRFRRYYAALCHLLWRNFLTHSHYCALILFCAPRYWRR